MPSFVHPNLLWWGLPLVGLPILIHLINMMRHRRVKWAAMEFLLASQKRHRTWIILKQFLLLLLRMTAIAALVLMLAQPLLRQQWGALFGGSKTHHIVLLDDSFSMSDRWADTSAFDQAKQVTQRLAARAARQDTPQKFTLLRFSRARRAGGGTQPDLFAEPVNSDFDEQLKKTLAPLQTSEGAAGPDEALQAAERLSAKADDENRVLYLVSDFRATQWQDPTALRKTLDRLQQGGMQLHLVNCVDAARGNLAIVSLEPAELGTRAAGVPLLMDVAVKNFGATAARQISVLLEEDGHARPAVVIEEVPPGKTVSRRFSVLFPTAGEHQIAAHLEGDPVSADNHRYCVVDLLSGASVLIIDGDPQARDAYFLTTALAPEGKIKTGIKPVVESPRFLGNHPLDKYETIFLLNIERLDGAEVKALEAFARAGGGVGFFLGELSRAEFFNEQLYRKGQGIFPVPLTRPTELLVDRADKAPDLEVTDHPIFSVFGGERNSLINTVIVEHYFGVDKTWKEPPDSSIRVIARLRNKAPLAVERKFGNGRVVAILTKAAPVQTPLGAWNNWGRDNPSYVVAMLVMQSYLAAGRHGQDARLVGTPLELPLDPAKYQPQVRFVLPADKAGGTLVVDAQGAASGRSATLADTDFSGIYEAQLKPTAGDNAVEVRRYAVNVLSDEGDLHTVDGPHLAQRLAGVKYEYHQAQDLAYDTQKLAGFNLGQSLLYLLAAILIGEQVLAYATSYHPRLPGGAR